MFVPNFSVKIDENVNSISSGRTTTQSSIISSSPTLPYTPLRNQGVLWVQDTSLKFTNGLGITNTISSDTGGVTEIDTGSGLIGGPITSSGTISIAPAGVTNEMLENNSILVTTTNGIAGGGTVQLGGELLLYLNQIEPVDSRTVYVSIGGSDVTGDGTILNPYASPTKAMSTITPTPSNKFLIVLLPGFYSGNINLKSNVSLFGYPNQNTTLSGNVTISDSSWGGNGANITTLTNIAIAGTSVFNFQTTSSQQGGLVFENVVFNSSFSVTGYQNNSVTTKSCTFAVGITVSGVTYTQYDSNSFGNASFNASNSTTTSFSVIGGSTVGDFNCNGLLGSQTVSGVLENNLVSGRIFVIGSNASLTCLPDALSILPSITNGGTLTITNFGNVGMNVDPNSSASGSGFAGAYTLKNYFTRIIDISSGNGVKLPNTPKGSVFCVRNDSSNNVLVYPDSLSSQINSLPLGSALTILPSLSQNFINYGGGVWCTF